MCAAASQPAPQCPRRACPAETLLEERRVNLRAAVVMGADVVQVSAVRQCVLGDNINVAAIEMLVLRRLAIVRREAFAEDHVSWAEAPRISPAVKYRILCHFRKDRFAVRPFEG